MKPECDMMKKRLRRTDFLVSFTKCCHPKWHSFLILIIAIIGLCIAPAYRLHPWAPSTPLHPRAEPSKKQTPPLFEEPQNQFPYMIIVELHPWLSCPVSTLSPGKWGIFAHLRITHNCAMHIFAVIVLFFVSFELFMLLSRFFSRCYIFAVIVPFYNFLLHLGFDEE